MPRTVVSLLLAVAACLHMVAGTHAAGPRAIQLSVDQLVSDWYQREFGISVPRPAIFNDERAVDCRGDGHLTSTAYLRTGSTTADLLVLYLTRDGLNLINKFRRNVLMRPFQRAVGCRTASGDRWFRPNLIVASRASCRQRHARQVCERSRLQCATC